MRCVTEAAQDRAAAAPAPGREKILSAAMETFGERGYEGASIAEIAERAETAKSAIYHHFGSKAALYEALFAAETADLIARVRGAVPQPVGDVREATRDVVDAYLGFVEARPAAWRLLVRDAPVDPDLVALYERFQQERARALLQLFPAISPDDTDKRLYVELLGIALRALATWWHDHPDVPREAIVDAIMDFAAASADRIGAAGA